MSNLHSEVKKGLLEGIIAELNTNTPDLDNILDLSSGYQRLNCVDNTFDNEEVELFKETSEQLLINMKASSPEVIDCLSRAYQHITTVSKE